MIERSIIYEELGYWGLEKSPCKKQFPKGKSGARHLKGGGFERAIIKGRLERVIIKGGALKEAYQKSGTSGFK